MKHKVCISGSSGFIASHIKRLLKDTHEFVPITQELLYSPDNLTEFFKKEKPDYIFNLAAYGNHTKQDNPAMIVFANIIGSFNMMYASLHTPYKKFVQFGSSSEYGEKSDLMKENDIPDPLTFYGASKVGATYLARAFAHNYNKPIVIVRPFSVYGEEEADFRFIPTLINKLSKGEEMELDTQGTHDWIYVEDFISGMVMAIEKGQNGEIINIGTGRQTTNLEVAQVMERLTGKILKYKEKKMRPNDSKVWAADASKLLGWGWRTKYPLALGLAKTMQWYEANKQTKNT